MKNTCLYISYFALILFASPCWATETRIVGTHVQLSATAEQQFANNEMVINFRIESEGMDAKLLRSKVNSISQAVNQNIKGRQGLHARKTINRQWQTRWQYNKPTGQQVRNGWLLQQKESITCDIKAGATIVMGIEKAGGHLDGIRFQIDQVTRQDYRQRLEQQAIKDFRRRASTLAKAFDASSFQVINIQTEQQHRITPQPTMERSMLKSTAVADALPILNSGEQYIRISVYGTIVLPKKDFLVTP